MRLLLVAVAALVFVGAASADTTFTDATGEDAAEADLSTVTVSNDPAAHTFKIAAQVTNMPTLETNSGIFIGFDSDGNAATGQASLDYLFAVDSVGWYFEKWDGSQWTDAPTATELDVHYVNGLMTAVFHETDVAAGPAFTFLVFTGRGADPDNPVIDTAGPWTYTLAKAPAVKPKPATVTSSSVTAATPPKAGTRFHVGAFAVNLSDGTSVTAKGEKCTATLGGVKLKGAGVGGCTFALPSTAKKKRLVVKVSGTYGGSTISKSVVYVVR